MFKRFDSLFARLLLAQMGLVLALVTVVLALFYVERNVAVAELFADRWAPPLASAAGLSSALSAPSPQPVRSRSDVPEATRRVSFSTPRFAALRRELALRNVPVDEMRLSLGGGEAMVWLHVVPEGRPAVWLGIEGQVVVPEWSRRVLVALALIGVLMLWIAWALARRLTRPLEALRERMASHTPGRSAELPTLNLSTLGASTEVTAMASAYADLLTRLTRHERERAVLLAGVSHDLRSPLARIAMAADLLPDSADVRARKASISRNVRDADRLIESFLDFVRAGELACDETVDVVAAARSVVAAFERPLDELALEAPAAPLMRANANRLLVERLLANLIDNAFKHGQGPVRVRLGADSARIWMEVVDSGPGIAPRHVERLQEAFTRGDVSRAAPGAGLGLAIVRQVATRLGGSVSFDRDDAGSRVRVTLESK
jgi:two-component system, OmpR family, osmolarity sensor histidine kinase EnvZ